MRVTDPQALKALSHPLRLDLIELLGTLGPATAADCARQLGTSQASCSFHLRQLAKYGFVEQAPDSSDRRERPWQMTDVRQSWSSADSGAVGVALEHTFLQRELTRLQAWADQQMNEPEAWQRATFVGGATLPMTADELRAAGDAMRAVLAPYVERLSDPARWPEGARIVRVFLGSSPVQHLGSPDTRPAHPGGTSHPDPATETTGPDRGHRRHD